jgi:translation initiation factor IF-2
MTEKLRVYQLAKELRVSSREVMWALTQLGEPAKNHMSTFEPALVDGIKGQLRIPVEKKPAPEPQEQAPAPAAPIEAQDRAPAAAGPPAPEPAAEPQAAEPQAAGPQAAGPQVGAHAPAPALAPEEDLTRRPGLRAKTRREKVRAAEGARAAERRARRSRGRTRLIDLQLEGGRPKHIIIEGPLTVGNLAQRLDSRPTELIRRLIARGVMAGISQEIEGHVAAELAAEMGFEVEERAGHAAAEEALLQAPAAEAGEEKARGPVVTVMGHVDHGKTSLLDAIRETNVTAQEAGGITQHIGASVVEKGGRRIVFLDTPGHEAFTAMRARGAQVTDIAIVVVAADDGVMPQTVEAINHARAARVPIMIALNKVDKPNVNIDRAKKQLGDLGLTPEDWGGDTVCVHVSAKQRTGIDELLEMVGLVADMQELKARYGGPARGTIIEAQVDRGRGPVATVIVREGTLEVGDAFVAGQHWGRVRAMLDDRGRRLRRAPPSTAVVVLGFTDVPAAGDELVVVGDEKRARDIAEMRQVRRKRSDLEVQGRVRLDRLFAEFKAGKMKELNLILKGDVQGSVEAVAQALEKLDKEDLRIRVIHSGVGTISESDVMLAAASGAIIIGFNVRPDANARRAAEAEHVDVRAYQIIYDAIDDVRKALEGMLEPEKREVTIGRAEVRAAFKVPRVGQVAGCYVTDGKIARSARVRVLRDGAPIHDGPIVSLKRFKDDAREVTSGYECGIGVGDFQDVQVGDVLEAYAVEEVRP